MIGPVSLSAIYLIGTAIGVIVAFRANRSRGAVARDVIGLAVCVAEWSLFYALETLAETREFRILWSQLAYIGTYGATAFLFRFCVRWLSPRRAGWWMALLWIVPTFMVVAAFTNGLHNLVWTEIRPSERFSYIYYYGHGPVFWVGIAYQYLLIASSIVLVVVGVARRRGIYRQQALLVLLGVVIAVGGNLLYVTRSLPGLPADITPLTLAVATGFLLAGISRAHLLELLPAARHHVVDVMPDGLIVLDELFRVVDWNQAALRIWHIDQADIMGTPVADLIPGWVDAVPSEPEDSLKASLQEGDADSVCHFIELELRRLSTRTSRPDGWIALFHDYTELRAAEIRLQEANARLEALNRELVLQAVHDGLTGLYNRGYLDEALPRELARARRDDRSVGLLILDVDHFKEVNDENGHRVGDAVLVRVSELVRSLVRAGDIPCRFGGDELVAVMPGATTAEALGAGERIRATVAADEFSHEGEGLSVTVSVGVAVFPNDAADAGELFRRADRALYAAKARGRNRVVGATDV